MHNFVSGSSGIAPSRILAGTIHLIVNTSTHIQAHVGQTDSETGKKCLSLVGRVLLICLMVIMVHFVVGGLAHAVHL